ncbi:carboxymuconolactone decarboxylase family protein [Halotalea alkalilenta]|uniref:carboxymuconolactone decarboxylase family protein n=1 Tax=Halotalea alkalilenta TaxID=376489 RepID=UPI000693E0D0|nr:carboxymuconolactone decarboxylase family protein [Halotalea alkalilenta]
MARQLIDVKDIYQASRGIRQCSLDPSIRCLAELRTCQLNGCEGCSHSSLAEAEALGISKDKVEQLADWATSSSFSARERAALAWCDNFIREHSNNSDIRRQAIETFSGSELADLTLTIQLTSTLNRVSRKYAN